MVPRFIALPFTPYPWLRFNVAVCPTEITAFSDRHDEFAAVNTEVLGVSVDSQFSHLAWIQTDRKVCRELLLWHLGQASQQGEQQGGPAARLPSCSSAVAEEAIRERASGGNRVALCSGSYVTAANVCALGL
jgi:hypothetical protein